MIFKKDPTSFHGERQSFQQVVLDELNIHIIVKLYPHFYHMKNELKMDWRPKHKS